MDFVGNPLEVEKVTAIQKVVPVTKLDVHVIQQSVVAD